MKVIELTVPALRERPDEIPTLTDFFVARYSRKYNRPARPISDELRQLFNQYEWPGNIRELENMIKRVVILQDEFRWVDGSILGEGPTEGEVVDAMRLALGWPADQPARTRSCS